MKSWLKNFWWLTVGYETYVLDRHTLYVFTLSAVDTEASSVLVVYIVHSWKLCIIYNKNVYLVYSVCFLAFNFCCSNSVGHTLYNGDFEQLTDHGLIRNCESDNKDKTYNLPWVLADRNGQTVRCKIYVVSIRQLERKKLHLFQSDL